MSNERRVYKIDPIQVNGRTVLQVIIDPHYELKHSAAVNDALILSLVNRLNGRHELPEAQKGRYAYFATLIEHLGKPYRLIWLLEDDAIYIGVVNAYRERKRRS